MKVSIGIGGAASGPTSATSVKQVDYLVEAEKLGVDVVWSAEV